ncbi:unnamed protein product [Sympodiomycopsis kandeliae]
MRVGPYTILAKHSRILISGQNTTTTTTSVSSKRTGRMVTSSSSSAPSSSAAIVAPPSRKKKQPATTARYNGNLPAGSNWQALKKTLETQAPATNPATTRFLKKRRLSSAATPADKGKGRQMDHLNENGKDRSATGSPAPTTLPWFAEDLSPEDLALVRNLNIQTGDNGNTPQWNGWDTQKGTEAEEERKKQIILGGHWDGPESASKREPGTYVAIDCEMVGVGIKGSESVLARVSIVNWHGYTLLDRFVKPQEKVTDYRTFVSGIRAKDLKDAPLFDTVQKEVSTLIKDRILVGHAIQNDLKAMLLDHPRRMIRDTSTFQPLRDLAQTKFPGLRKLATIVLGIDVQKKGQEHSSVEDARTTMAIFRTQKDAWEKVLREEQGKMARRHAKKAAKLGADNKDEKKKDSAGSEGGSATPAKRKTNQATANWWLENDW